MSVYTKDHEKKLTATISELLAAGKTQKQVAEELNARGEKNAEGGSWSSATISYFIGTRRRKLLSLAGVKEKPKRKTMHTYKIRRKAGNGAQSSARVDGVSRSVLESIITDPHLNPQQQVKMIGAYLSA